MSEETINKKQKLLLEYVFSNTPVYIKCHSIMKPSFFEPPLDKVVTFVKEHFSEYHALPDVDIIDAETGIQLKERDVDASEEHYVLDELEDHCQREAMTEAVLASVDMINEGDVTSVQRLVREALTVRIDTKLGTELFTDVAERMSRSNIDLDERGIGIPALDTLMDSVRRRELIFFLAGTSVGKSVMLANIARLMSKQKLDSLIISVEMGEDMYSKRLDAMVTGIPLSKEPDANAIAEELSRVHNEYGRITTKRVSNRFGIEDLRTFIMEYHLRYGKYPDVLILDYMDIFSNGNIPRGVNGKFEWDEVKSHSVRDICEEFDMYGFTASQTNRSAYGGVTDIGAEHMGGGLSKAQAADGVIALIATEEDLENNTLTAKAVKLRNANRGELKPITLYRCPKTLRLSDQPFIGKQSSPAIKKKDKAAEEKAATTKAISTGSGKDKLKAALNMAKKR